MGDPVFELPAGTGDPVFELPAGTGDPVLEAPVGIGEPGSGAPAGSGERPAGLGGTAPIVFLHIGTMKTGTSFLQTVLRRNTRLLEEHGIRYPLAGGTRWALQVNAARDILGITGRPTDGAWDAMVAQIHAWTGRAAVVSMEFYSLAPASRVRAVVAGLAPSRVQVVITARDLVRVMPSAWQSMVKQGHPWSFPEFATAVVGGADGDHPAYGRFWRHSDVAAIAARWAAEVGVENVHVVTVAPSGAPATLLWERFCSVIDVPAEPYDVSQDRNSNFSLSFSDSELLRSVHAALGSDLDRAAQKRWATRFLANRVLRASSAERTAHDRPMLDATAYEWAISRSHAMVAAVADLGVDVVGDLADLIPRPADASITDSYAEPAVVHPERAATVIAALVRRIAEVDQHSPAAAGADAEVQDPDDAAELDEAMEALQPPGDEAEGSAHPATGVRLARAAGAP